MKPGSFLLLTLLLFFLYSNIAAQKMNLKKYCERYQEKGKGKEIPCTMEYQGHCGSDGITYGNRCLFCHAYFKSGRRLQLRYLGECGKFEDAED